MFMSTEKGKRDDIAPDDFGAALNETVEALQDEFHARLKTRQVVARRRAEMEALAKQSAENRYDAGRRSEPGEVPPEEFYPPVYGEEIDGERKAVVVIGKLTGFFLADNAFRNTAREAVSDFVDRGYATTLLDTPTAAQLAAMLADPAVKAFAFVGHGAGSDSDTPAITGPGGSDFLWLNAGEVATSFDVQKWVGGRGFDVAILHACYQGAQNTAARWRAAFAPATFKSWYRRVNCLAAYWWQFAWD